jgi:hypothetical protein
MYDSILFARRIDEFSLEFAFLYYAFLEQFPVSMLRILRKLFKNPGLNAEMFDDYGDNWELMR